MKRKVLSGLVITLALLVITFVAVWASSYKPPQPQCPEGTVEVTPAQWVAPIPGHYTCPNGGTLIGKWCRKGFFNWYPAAYVPGVEGYWIDPICEAPPIEGCTNPLALNFDQEAEIDDGSCILPVEGCTDPAALNFNPGANVDNDTCDYTIPASPPGFDIGCRSGENWAYVTPVFDEGIVSIEIVGVATYYPPTGQAVKLGPGSYQYNILLAEGFDADFQLSGNVEVLACPTSEKTPLPPTSW